MKPGIANFPIVLVLILACAWSPTALAKILSVELIGLEGELRDNALAWLGDPPDSPQVRSNYVFSAQDKVERSLQALGYYRADVDLQLERKKPVWQLTITVDPGEPVRYGNVDVRILGEAADDSAFQELAAASLLVPGEVLNHEHYEQLKRTLNALGQRRGYFDASFRTSRIKVEPVAGTADIQLEYDSGLRYRFGPLQFEQEIVNRDLILPLLAVEEGEPYDQLALQRTQAQLQRTGFFSTVILHPEPALASDGLMPLNLEMYQAKRHSFDVGVGFSTDTEERLSLTWRTPRINRWGHSQETRLQYSSVNPSGRIIYTIPLTHPLNDLLQFSVRQEENEFGDLDSNQKELAVRREISRDSWVYSYSLRTLNESWDAQGIDRENDYLLPGFSLSHRYRQGNLVNPDRGFSQWYRLEAGSADLGSDVDVVRMSANFGFIQSLGEKHRMVLRSDIGAAIISDEDRGQLAPSLNFFAGGGQSIRGFSYQSIGNEIDITDENGDQYTLVVGGDRLLTASAEYQYSFNETWRGAVFIDGGDAFDDGEFDLNYGAGFGVHYVTQVGAIRLELANPMSKDNPSWRMHLAIGAEF